MNSEQAINEGAVAGGNARGRELGLGLVMFLLGGCGLAYEYTFSKVASDLLGNSVQQWSIVIALMLFAMGLGAEVQKHVKEERLADVLIGSQAVLAVLGAYGPIALLYIFALEPTHFALVQYGFTLLIGVIIGLEIPLIVRLNEHFSPEVRANLARVLKLDYIGALFGSLLWVFFLLKFFSVTETAFVLGLTSTATAAFCLALFRGQTTFPRTLASSLAVAGVACLAGFVNSGQLSIYAEQSLFRDPVIYSETTRYQHIVLTQKANGRLNCYINGNLQFSSSDEHIYHENLVHPVMAAAPRRDRVLILGGGDGLALREVLKYPDVKAVTLVDIDPEMTRLARENPWLRAMNGNSLADPRAAVVENRAATGGEIAEVTERDRSLREPREPVPAARVEVLNLDAASFVRQAEGSYNIVIIDFPDPNSPDLAKLYSEPFYHAVRDCLTADGLMVQQSTSPVHAKEAYLCIGRTMRAAGLAVVPFHDNVPSFGEWGWWLAGREGALYDAAKLRARLEGIRELPVETRYLTPELIHGSLNFGRDQLETSEKAITTLTDSRILQYYLKSWDIEN
jgi:spermidine synthase